jgi:nitrogen regulatory protein P-II 1
MRSDPKDPGKGAARKGRPSPKPKLKASKPRKSLRGDAKMKRVEAIVRTGKVSDVTEALEEVGVPGIMISEIEGHGRQGGVEDTVRGKKYKVELLIKAKIDVIVKDSEVDKVVNAIREAAVTGKVGDGKIFVSPVDNAIRIRTNDKGESAL